MLNYIEKKVASILMKSPRLKRPVKYLYTLPFTLIGNVSMKSKTAHPLTRFGEESKESFFGYYDVQPENSSKQVLCHQTSHDSANKPNPNMPIEIAVFDQDSPTKPFFKTSTQAYNWQQGARLQWVNDEEFVFNDYDNKQKRYIAKRINIKSASSSEIFSSPIQTLVSEQKYLSLNYTRLAKLRPDYGYFNISPLKFDLNNLESDGIDLVDMENNTSSQLYKLSDIVNFNFEPNYAHKSHKVNHLLLSPNKRDFLILHRIFNGESRTGRLLMGNLNGDKLKLLPCQGIVSHYAWMSEEIIIVYGSVPNDGVGYFKINVSTGEYSRISEMNELIGGDGHPSVSSQGKIITDTYPDRYGYQKLIGFDDELNLFELAKLKHPRRYRNEMRCDLHPRWAQDGAAVYFDSIFQGKRGLYKTTID